MKDVSPFRHKLAGCEHTLASGMIFHDQTLGTLSQYLKYNILLVDANIYIQNMKIFKTS